MPNLSGRLDQQAIPCNEMSLYIYVDISRKLLYDLLFPNSILQYITILNASFFALTPS